MLQDRVAIITGAAHPDGIGFAVARKFAASGARIVIIDLDASACVQAAASLNQEYATPDQPLRALGIAGNVCDRSSLEAVVSQTLSTFGGLDIVVNNAGIAQPRKIMDITDSDWQATLDVNLRGMLYMAQASIPHMNTGGSIVCLASIAAQRGGGLLGGPHYAASKGGVLALAKSMAREFAPKNIRVNCVNPGVIITAMNRNAFDAATQQKMLDNIPLARFGTPDDVANVCLFLASPLSAYVTGSAIDINGGMHIH